MLTKIHNIDLDDAEEILAEISDRPQPLYIYRYSALDYDYLVVSDVEIDSDDFESVVENLIEGLEEDRETEDWLDE